MSSQRKVQLWSSDHVKFEVDLVVLQDAKLVMETVEITDEYIICLPNVPSTILIKVIQYCTYHLQSNSATDDEIKHWDAAFVKVDHPTLLGLIHAGNYMNLRPLLDLVCQRAADLINGKSVEEIKSTFGIVHDDTPKEGAENATKQQWFFPVVLPIMIVLAAFSFAYCFSPL